MMRLTYRSVTPSSFAIAEVDGAPPEKSLSLHLYALVSALISVALGRGCSSRACPGGITSRTIFKRSSVFFGAPALLAVPLQDVGQDLQCLIELVGFHGCSFGLSIRVERKFVRPAVSASPDWDSKLLRSEPDSPRRLVDAPVCHPDPIAANGHETAPGAGP